MSQEIQLQNLGIKQLILQLIKL